MSRTLIVGSSVAGVNCALSLRGLGFDGEITLVDLESVSPYDKPQLSKEVMAGRADFDDIALLPADAGGMGLSLLKGQRAVSIDLPGNTVGFSSGYSIEYDNLVIATGARARPSPWRRSSRVYTLRTYADSLALRDEMVPGRRLGIVGAGFIGAEVAATASRLGVEVTMIDPEKTPMARAFDSDIGQLFIDLHRENGVDLALGEGVENVVDDGTEVTIRLTTGRELTVDFVLVGIGSIPNVAWLDGSGLDITNGVLCGPNGLAVGQENVYSVGDVSRWTSPSDGTAHRAEHWTNAIDQASCVAHNLINPDDQRHHDPISYVWSDQYDWKIQVAGQTTSQLKTTLLGKKPHQRAILFEDVDGRLMGAATINWAKAMILSRKALAANGFTHSLQEALQPLQTSTTV